MADAMLSGDGEVQAQALLAAAELYAPALGLSARDVVDAAHSSRTRLTQLAQAMNLQVAPGAPARRLLQSTSPASAALAAASSSARPMAAAVAASDKTLVMAPGPTTAAQDQLSSTLEQVRSALADQSLRPNEVLNLVLGSMHRALDFRHVVFCLREPATGQLVGRLALGEGAAERRGSFRFTPDGSASGNLFAWLAARGADLLISDSNSFAARLPAWYRQRINAPTFLLLPVMLKARRSA
jgi:hypothetical protein